MSPIMLDQLTHIADVKVGEVKGKSKVYPQLRLPSQYADLAGKKASIYEMSGYEGDTAFLVRFDGSTTKTVAAFHERAERAGASFACDEPCRGSDSGSNPDSGAPFLPLFDKRRLGWGFLRFLYSQQICLNCLICLIKVQ